MAGCATGNLSACCGVRIGAHRGNEVGFCICLNRRQLHLSKRTDEIIVLTIT